MDKKHLYAVILAGGSGTRFWPVSRKALPKQFLNIVGEQTLFEQVLTRIQSVIPSQNIFVVGGKEYAQLIARQSKPFKVPAKNILLEPEGKNTAPAIGWAASRIYQSDPQAIMAVLPSDHLIVKPKKFLSILKRAFVLAGEDYLVTLGIPPTRVETGYGYLKTSIKSIRGKQVYFVDQFKEKPEFLKAKQYCRKKNYYWNSGMFVWKCEVILDEFQNHLSKAYRMLETKNSAAHIQTVWHRMPNISIDYGILEKSKRVVAVPAPGLGWSDLGSWESLVEMFAKDQSGNSVKGEVISIDSKNTFVWGGQKVIGAVGVDNLIIIDTPDALLICRKDMTQRVKDVVAALQKKRRSEI